MFDSDQLIHNLSSVSHFRKLPLSSIREIVSAGGMHTYFPGKVIFGESEPCAGLFVLLRGQVHLCKISRQGQESIVDVIEPVIMFNEVAALDGGPNPFTAVANTPCIAWTIQVERFHPLMERYPILGLSLLKVLAARSRKLLNFCEDVAFRSVTGRTAKILLDISNRGMMPINRKEYSNKILAARAATVSEPLCRVIQTLHHSGVIHASRSKITVCDPVELTRLADIDTGCPES